MKQDYELIPGVRQDHNGVEYQIGRYPDGRLINVPVSLPPLSPKTTAQLEKVDVVSQSTLTLNAEKDDGEKRNPAWVETALRVGTLHRRGQVYESLAVFQGRRGE